MSDREIHNGAELEEDVARLLAHRWVLAQDAVWLLQLGRAVGVTARLADVAVLVLGATLGTLALDEPVG